ncbi:MAG: hypothetical protein KC466_09900, partial [Myxococcales bacterium]|nr:hypothetical protein [Myxococcales bacterium]
MREIWKRFRLTVLITAVIGGTALFVTPALPVSVSGDQPYENLKVFTDALSIISRNYVETTDSKDLVHGAIRGMLASLDPHSSFMPP